jgi:hypothetical protein
MELPQQRSTPQKSSIRCSLLHLTSTCCTWFFCPTLLHLFASFAPFCQTSRKDQRCCLNQQPSGCEERYPGFPPFRNLNPESGCRKPNQRDTMAWLGTYLLSSTFSYRKRNGPSLTATSPHSGQSRLNRFLPQLNTWLRIPQNGQPK